MPANAELQSSMTQSLFDSTPVGGTKQEGFEQIARFTLSTDRRTTMEAVIRLAADVRDAT